MLKELTEKLLMGQNMVQHSYALHLHVYEA
jgi:hypothetical protein